MLTILSIMLMPIMNTTSPQLASPTGMPSGAQDPMAAFKELALPEPTSTLPAIGWWLLGFTLIVGLLISSRLIWTAYKNRQARREATKAIEQANSATELNRIIKRAALAYFPREDVAALTGAPWYQFLSQQIKASQAEKVCPPLKLMINNLYLPPQHTLSSAQLSQFKQACQQWLKLALPPQVMSTHKTATKSVQNSEVSHV